MVPNQTSPNHVNNRIKYDIMTADKMTYLNEFTDK